MVPLANFMRLVGLLLFGSAICLGQAASPAVPQFEDIGKQSGLTVPNISSKDEYYIVESMSGGAGFIDCDNDGKLDILTVNGSTVERYKQGGDLMVTLYHQDPNLKFSNITESAGLTRKGWGIGVSVVDYDNDGWQDLYVTGYGANVLYRNVGNCKFEDVTEKAGLRVGGFSAGAAWGRLRSRWSCGSVRRSVRSSGYGCSTDDSCRWRALHVHGGARVLRGRRD